MRSLRLAVSGIVLAALVLGSLAVATPASAAVDCSVKNKSRGGTYSDLQAAIDDAHSGDGLHVEGTCTGTFDVDKNLRVRGGSTNRATLDGGQNGTTLRVEQLVTLFVDGTLVPNTELGHLEPRRSYASRASTRR